MFAPRKIANEFPVTALQILPHVPGGLDGVGDYALTLATKLRDAFGCATVFAVPGTSSTSIRDFEVRPLEHLAAGHQFDHAILHYVNYGYQKRGIPFELLSTLRRMRASHGGKFVTIFHELYASGPPWTSSFWLRPIQIHLTKSIARLSDECIVSSEGFLRELRRLVSEARVHLHPCPSGLGEPSLSAGEVENRDPHQWVIVGGTVLAESSLRSFIKNIDNIPESIAPKKLFVLGGNDNPAVRSLLADVRFKSDYRPRISAVEASEILKTCSFSWFNYFHQPNVETSVALKSSAFAALCAHAVVPIFPHRGTAISLDGDSLPGPFFVEPAARDVPNIEGRSKAAMSIYHWYRGHASSEHLVRGVAQIFGLDRR